MLSFNTLTRDTIVLQNAFGYKTLALISSSSLRLNHLNHSSLHFHFLSNSCTPQSTVQSSSSSSSLASTSPSLFF
ncbi:hypothetical protein LguiA_028529 [Lonicera macranthoides]